MSVHIFTVSEENFEICQKRGLVGIPETTSDNVFDGLVSRMNMIKENDYILMYVLGKKRVAWCVAGRRSTFL